MEVCFTHCLPRCLPVRLLPRVGPADKADEEASGCALGTQEWDAVKLVITGVQLHYGSSDRLARINLYVGGTVTIDGTVTK